MAGAEARVRNVRRDAPWTEDGSAVLTAAAGSTHGGVGSSGVPSKKAGQRRVDVVGMSEVRRVSGPGHGEQLLGTGEVPGQCLAQRVGDRLVRVAMDDQGRHRDLTEAGR